MKHQALDWLYKELKKKRIALGRAEAKPNAPAGELEDIKKAIEIIEWLTDVALNSKAE
jgi:hypothetical protein